MKLIPTLLLALCLAASAQTTAKRPKLVLAITIDQFRYDYLTRFRDQYNGGLSRLLTTGAVFTNANYQHFPTVTAIGHSTYMTGALPSVSGIVGNEWYDRETGAQVTSVADDKVSMLGGESRAKGGAASPRRLMVSTVGDELKLAGRGSKVIGVSVKDRSAILPAGHMADGAFWFDPTSGNFVSSTHYFADLPGWVKDYNQTRYVDKFAGQEWKPVGGGTAFKTMATKLDKDYFTSLEKAPYGNEMVERFAEAAISGEGLGKRNTTDVLAVSFSSNDYVGHDVGPEDPQVKDISIRTDRLLAALFKFIDAQVGMSNVLVILTADHGVAPVPELNRKRGMPGGRLTEKAVSDKIQQRLAEKYGEGNWVAGKSGFSQFLNAVLAKEKRLSMTEVSETAAAAVREMPQVFRVYTRDQLRRGAVPGDIFDRRVLNGFNQARAADVTVVPAPYFMEGTKGASHGTPFSYDTHVPIIFMGEGIKPGRYHFQVTPNDIAPTLATFLDVETPSGSVGRALYEIYAVAPAVK